MKYELANYVEDGKVIKIEVRKYTQNQLEDMEQRGEFVCPGEHCDAKLCLVHNSKNGGRTYFMKAIDDTKHSVDCEYKIGNYRPVSIREPENGFFTEEQVNNHVKAVDKDVSEPIKKKKDKKKTKNDGKDTGGNILYVAHELAALYADYGVTYHRRYFKWLLRSLYQAESVEVDMPAQSRIHFVKRPVQNQYVLHLMYASPVQRGCTSVLEDFPTLYNTCVKVNVEEKLQSVKLMPQNTEIGFETADGGYVFTVPAFSAHQMVVMQY